jgi:hypothetical protein
VSRDLRQLSSECLVYLSNLLLMRRASDEASAGPKSWPRHSRAAAFRSRQHARWRRTSAAPRPLHGAWRPPPSYGRRQEQVLSRLGRRSRPRVLCDCRVRVGRMIPVCVSGVLAVFMAPPAVRAPRDNLEKVSAAGAMLAGTGTRSALAAQQPQPSRQRRFTREPSSVKRPETTFALASVARPPAAGMASKTDA